MSTETSSCASGTPADKPATTPTSLIAVAWLVVALPAAWGVTQTTRQAAALFQSAPAARPATAPTTAPVTPPTVP